VKSGSEATYEKWRAWRGEIALAAARRRHTAAATGFGSTGSRRRQHAANRSGWLFSGVTSENQRDWYGAENLWLPP
jgi:hypothetical protein